MRNLILAFGAMSLAVPAAMTLPAAKAEAKSYTPSADQQRRSRNKRYEYREWRGRDGRTYCRKPDGTTGAVIGAVGGALVGRTIDTHGDRTVGTLGGAILGGLAGREIDRSNSRNKRHCR